MDVCLISVIVNLGILLASVVEAASANGQVS